VVAEERTDPFQVLPFELLQAIFFYLDHRSVLAAMQVCRQWHTVACGDAVWMGVASRLFKNHEAEYENYNKAWPFVLKASCATAGAADSADALDTDDDSSSSSSSGSGSSEEDGDDGADDGADDEERDSTGDEPSSAAAPALPWRTFCRLRLALEIMTTTPLDLTIKKISAHGPRVITCDGTSKCVYCRGVCQPGSVAVSVFELRQSPSRVHFGCYVLYYLLSLERLRFLPAFNLSYLSHRLKLLLAHWMESGAERATIPPLLGSSSPPPKCFGPPARKR